MVAGPSLSVVTQFDLSPELTYLNHAGIGPPSHTAIRRSMRVLELQAELGSLGSPIWQGFLAGAREKAARLIGAASAEVAFMKNTPEAISVVASGLRWRPGDNVVVPDCEFPANVYPWMNLSRLGVEVRWVRAHSGVFSIDDIAHVMDDRTRLVAVSWVQFLSGFRLDLHELGDLCDRRKSLLLVDAIQGLGVVPLDVKRANIHFLATASHKWLLAPMGAGWLYCRQDLIDELDLTEVGQGTVKPLSSYTEYVFEPKPDARRFEPGVPPYASLAGLDGALEVLESVGVDNVHDHVANLCDQLIEGLLERGCQVLTPRERERRAGIVTFRHPKRASDEIERDMASRGVIVAHREGCIRVAPHITNRPEQIDRFFETL